VNLEALAAQFGLAIAESAAVYLPALKRLAMDELVAFIKCLTEKNRDGAYAILAAKMTDEELVAEKEKLADLTEARATAQAEAIETFNAIGLAILKAALSMLLAGALL